MLSFVVAFLANSCFGNLFKCHRRSLSVSSSSSRLPGKITRSWMRRNDSLVSKTTKSAISSIINAQDMNNNNIRQEQFNFTLSTYNILAPSLAYEHKYLYSNVDSRYLCWDYRKKKIIDEIKLFNSDVN
jgi:hypothetical protein